MTDFRVRGKLAAYFYCCRTLEVCSTISNLSIPSSNTQFIEVFPIPRLSQVSMFLSTFKGVLDRDIMQIDGVTK